MFSFTVSTLASTASLTSMPRLNKSAAIGFRSSLPLLTATAPIAPSAKPPRKNRPYFMFSFMSFSFDVEFHYQLKVKKEAYKAMQIL